MPPTAARHAAVYNLGMPPPPARCLPVQSLPVQSRPIPGLRAAVCGLVLVMPVVAVVPAISRGQVVLPPNFGVPAGLGVKPSPTHDLALEALAAGDYRGGLELARQEYASSVQIGASRWIDSIASASLVGECLYEFGELQGFRDAVVAYEEALQLAALHADWMLSVTFPPLPAAPAPQRAATWGRSRRNAQPVRLPEAMLIRRQGGDPQKVLQEGGVLAAPFDQQVRPVTIMRALAVALYRHHEILGRLTRENAAVAGIATALARRPAPPNHYAQAWIDVALGTALWSQGKADQALPLLNRGLLLNGQFDHPLTAWGLIVLGRIALDSDQAPQAAALFEEATYTAADYGDARALEEAFRWVFAAHMAAGGRDVPATIRGAAEWAADRRSGMPVLAARLRAFSAEAAAAAGNLPRAQEALAGIDQRLLAGDPGRGALGAEAAYAAAVLAAAAGRPFEADLTAALTVAQGRSTSLFQLATLVALQRSATSGVSDREAEAILARLLGPPQPRDFPIDPLATLALVVAPRADAFDAWLALGGRRGDEAKLEVAEAWARQRWLVQQPLGGRRAALERLLTADPAVLDAAAAARRAALVAARPALGAAVAEATRLRDDLAAADPPGAGDWKPYEKAVADQRRLVAQLAVGRDPTSIDFPPLTPTKTIRSRLAPRQMILSFHWSQAELFGVLESREQAAMWKVRQAGQLEAEIRAFAKACGLFDPVAAISTDRLVAGDWSGSAARIERMLLENSRVDLTQNIDELVIVPDGWLWYVPFELLPASSARPVMAAGAAATPRLRDACRIRYAPTRSLAVMPVVPPRRRGAIGIQVGRMSRGDSPDAVAAVAAEMAGRVPRAATIPFAPGRPPALAAGLFDAVAFLEPVGGDLPAAAWPLVPAAAGRPALLLGEWAAPPRKRPAVVVLPALQTAMAAFDKLPPPPRPGDDIFQPAVDLLAAGATTAVLSRWRTGGQTSVALATEFLADLATAGDGAAGDESSRSPADSWHRAVDVVAAEVPDPAREPRLKQHPAAVLSDGRHPFLWAGPLLIDCGAAP